VLPAVPLSPTLLHLQLFANSDIGNLNKDEAQCQLQRNTA
jgi:hypothetical protein